MKTTVRDVEEAIFELLDKASEGDGLSDPERFYDSHVLRRDVFGGLELRLASGERFTIHVRKRP